MRLSGGPALPRVYAPYRRSLNGDGIGHAGCFDFSDLVRHDLANWIIPVFNFESSGWRFPMLTMVLFMALTALVACTAIVVGFESLAQKIKGSVAGSCPQEWCS